MRFLARHENRLKCLVRKELLPSLPLSEPILSSLPEPFRSVLLSMYAGDFQLTADGEKHFLDPAIGICPAEGIWIYQLCRQVKPQATLEIGLAYGFSTLYFLAALSENSNGRHTSVDPYQRNAPGRWAGIGLAQGRSMGGERFRFIEERSFAALTHLADNFECFDIIFVDGRHLFDFVLTEFTLRQSCPPWEGTLSCTTCGCHQFSEPSHSSARTEWTSNTLKLRWPTLRSSNIPERMTGSSRTLRIFETFGC